MDQSEETVKKCEVVIDEVNNVQNNSSNSSNTLKSVRKKIRSLTLRRKADENLSKSDSIDDQKDMNRDRNIDESLGKSKITLKKIFRKSSFKKIISNISNTIFTVSREDYLHSWKKSTELSIVREEKSWIRSNDSLNYSS